MIEGLGDAALLAGADDLDAWIDRVRSLDDRERYDARSTAARARVAALAEARHGEIDRLESALCDLARGDAVRAREHVPVRGPALIPSVHRASPRGRVQIPTGGSPVAGDGRRGAREPTAASRVVDPVRLRSRR